MATLNFNNLNLGDAPPTPGKNLDLSSYRIPKLPASPEPMDSQPTPGQKPRDVQPREKITLSDKAKKMVWGELAKIKQVRTLASKAHFFGKDIEKARAENRILPAFAIQKHLPQLPGGDLSWAFQTEWESILTECSEKLMDATAKYLVAEKVTSLDKKANNLAELTQMDLEKAIPETEREKGLRLFHIVNHSMKRLKWVKSGRISKPTKPVPGKKHKPANKRRPKH